MDTPTQLLHDGARASAARVGANLIARRFRIAARRLLARWLRQRQAARMSAELRRLDARTLRDLGFDRSEIDSVVAEITGDAERTRVVSRRVRWHPLY
jgi:uncharacterized protein YjiS (DUF1127 family)